MQILGWGVILAAIWLWLEQPFLLAVLGGITAGAIIGYALRGMSGAERPSEAVLEAPAADPAAVKLESMGFRPSEYRVPLAKARASGNPDPVAYVMGVLIR